MWVQLWLATLIFGSQLTFPYGGCATAQCQCYFYGKVSTQIASEFFTQVAIVFCQYNQLDDDDTVVYFYVYHDKPVNKICSNIKLATNRISIINVNESYE